MIEKLESHMADARQQVVDAYVAIRNASPAYRQMVGQNFLPTTLEDVQPRLAGEDRLVLEYILGSKAGYLIVIPPTGQESRIETLSISDAQAAKLKVKAGPLTGAVLKQVLMNEEGSVCCNSCGRTINRRKPSDCWLSCGPC